MGNCIDCGGSECICSMREEMKSLRYRVSKATEKPQLADECEKLLDNGWMLMLFRNRLGSYSVVATKRGVPQRIIKEGVISDDFTPSRALLRIAEKVLGTGEYGASK